MAIYKEQDGQPIVEYSRYKDEHSWKAEFFSRDDEKQLLREACPLTRNGNQYRFIHRSLLEYGLALAAFDPHDLRQSTTSLPSLGRRGSVRSVSSFEMHGADEREVRTVEQGPDLSSPLAWRSFVNEHSFIQFLEERVQQQPVFKQQLLDYIDFSRVDKKWRTAAANAITILVRAGGEFRWADLQGIRIPGADLSHGVFESANLKGADLRKVNLSNLWLHGSDLSGAHMKDVQFGELPFLKFDHNVLSCMYAPNGSTLAMVLSDNTINVYATTNWERAWILSGHSKDVNSITYSPNGDLIVSGSKDCTVRVWEVATGDCLYIFIGHTDSVNSVLYSPQGRIVASRGFEGTVRLWDVSTGDCRSTISGFGYIIDIAFSPHGDNIAFSSIDDRIRLWDVATKECRSILIGHAFWTNSVKYSVQGDLLISNGYDKVLRVWDVATGACRHIIKTSVSPVLSPKGNQFALYDAGGKEMELWNLETDLSVRKIFVHDQGNQIMAYSPQGDQIASGGYDGRVRLWDVETGECRHTMVGHTDVVRNVLFSPNGDHIASVSDDKTVRLWSVGSGASRKISNHHRAAVTGLKYSPKWNQIASCSWDSTIRLWDPETGICCRTLTGHSGVVWKISYSLPRICSSLAAMTRRFVYGMLKAGPVDAFYLVTPISSATLRFHYKAIRSPPLARTRQLGFGVWRQGNVIMFGWTQ